MGDFLGLFINLGIFLILISLGYLIGSARERKHFASIVDREAEMIKLPAINAKFPPENPSGIQSSQMVYGNVVISIDYFKRILAGIRMLFGGRVGAYESLIDRARREAILRMKANAPVGTSIIVNMRLETTTIGNSANQNSVGSVEVLAYGTAIIGNRP